MRQDRPMLRRPGLALLWLGFTATTVNAASPAKLTGILTQIDGAVQLAGPGVRGAPLATLWQVIRSGVTVRLPEATAAGVVCSNRRFVRLRGPAAWSLSEATCAAGKELTPGEYASVAPQAGRFKVVEGLLTLEREIRGGDEDDPLAPVVLSPRNTVLRSPRPTLSWTRVPSAVEYRVEWSGPGAGYDTRLSAGDVACGAGPDGIEICSQPWPADRPDLFPDATYFLQVAAHGGVVEPWHEADRVVVQTQKLSAAAALDRRLQDLESFGLAGSLAIVRAGLLAAGGLYADAAEAYRRVLTSSPTPELRVTLGDVYLAMGLVQLAEPRYREAAREGGPSVQAAVAFGLGRVEYARGRYCEAASDFRQAQKLYAAQALGEEEAAARRAAERAAARAPKE